ncbi:hypothetical protein B0T17DRAFT_122153 [Bombardia bombarda]|uniref:Protein kinase domain-containing protein n=1 Tax=Bombardia bombarda TaxID=252184 RepID=A0AA39TRY8_9PEZI|nr:hypothetical protein B0T17DRAFT_122153 [Bombardia bombarda]
MVLENYRRRSARVEWVELGYDPGEKASFFKGPCPPEIRFARLDDHRTKKHCNDSRLPDEPYFQQIYAYGFPDPAENIEKDGSISSVSMYAERLNGGTLDDLLALYVNLKEGGTIPETFLWHVMEQLGRAIIFLQTGLTRQDLEPFLSGQTDIKPPRKHNWDVIVHRDIHQDTVRLHYANPDAVDPEATWDDIFPRVVLTSFGKAGKFADKEDWWEHHFDAGESAGPSKPSPSEDIYALGGLLRMMVVCRDHALAGVDDADWNIDRDTRMDDYLGRNLGHLQPDQKAPYSDEFISALKRWEVPVLQLGAPYHEHRGDIMKGDILMELVREAAQRVAGYKQQNIDDLLSFDGECADVSWTRPNPRATDMMPFRPPVGIEGEEVAGKDWLDEAMKTLNGDWHAVKLSYRDFILPDAPFQHPELPPPPSPLAPSNENATGVSEIPPQSITTNGDAQQGTIAETGPVTPSPRPATPTPTSPGSYTSPSVPFPDVSSLPPTPAPWGTTVSTPITALVPTTIPATTTATAPTTPGQISTASTGNTPADGTLATTPTTTPTNIIAPVPTTAAPVLTTTTGHTLALVPATAISVPTVSTGNTPAPNPPAPISPAEQARARAEVARQNRINGIRRAREERERARKEAAQNLSPKRTRSGKGY